MFKLVVKGLPGIKAFGCISPFPSFSADEYIFTLVLSYILGVIKSGMALEKVAITWLGGLLFYTQDLLSFLILKNALSSKLVSNGNFR